MKARCPRCGLDRRARNPRGGDGTVVIVCRHDRTSYDHMQGERTRGMCPGSYSTVDWPEQPRDLMAALRDSVDAARVARVPAPVPFPVVQEGHSNE